jgi:predicted RNA-binding protein YlqC (UPF0109 family)
MKEILETVIKALVYNQEAVKINAVEGEKSIVYEVKVADEDMGKVIGKDGKIARAIRTLIKALAAKEQKRVSIEFIG